MRVFEASSWQIVADRSPEDGWSLVVCRSTDSDRRRFRGVVAVEGKGWRIIRLQRLREFP